MIEIRRDDDGELLGFVTPGTGGGWRALAVFGAAALQEGHLHATWLHERGLPAIGQRRVGADAAALRRHPV